MKVNKIELVPFKEQFTWSIKILPDLIQVQLLIIRTPLII